MSCLRQLEIESLRLRCLQSVDCRALSVALRNKYDIGFRVIKAGDACTHRKCSHRKCTHRKCNAPTSLNKQSTKNKSKRRSSTCILKSKGHGTKLTKSGTLTRLFSSDKKLFFCVQFRAVTNKLKFNGILSSPRSDRLA